MNYLLFGSVEALNISSQHMGTTDVQVGNVVYSNLPYYGQRMRIRCHLEIYSLEYNQLIWGNVIEGLGHKEV